MERLRFGVGEYKYFASPLPPLVAAIRTAIYPHLARTANRWCHAMGGTDCIRRTSSALSQLCRRAGQTKPTPLLLRYDAGGYNCLHQDLYGEVAFPLQLTCLLSRSRCRLQRRRIPAGRKPPARPEPRRSGRAGAGRGDHLREQRAAGRRQPRPLPGNDAPRGEPGAPRPPLQPGDHFSRREITARPDPSGDCDNGCRAARRLANVIGDAGNERPSQARVRTDGSVAAGLSQMQPRGQSAQAPAAHPARGRQVRVRLSALRLDLREYDSAGSQGPPALSAPRRGRQMHA